MPTIESVDLYYNQGSSDKVYSVQLVQNPDNGAYRVDFQYGRRGAALTCGSKIADAPLTAAQKVYEKLMAEKTGKGYQVSGKSANYSGQGASGFAVSKGPGPTPPPFPIFVPHLLMPIGEKDVNSYLMDDEYCIQEKKDGKHVTLQQIHGTIIARNKLGKAFPMSGNLKLIEGIHIDCEQIGDTFYVFDLMMLGARDIKDIGYEHRIKHAFQAISALNDAQTGSGIRFEGVPYAIGYHDKKALYDRIKRDGREGVVFKNLSNLYTSAARDVSMVKFKFTHTLTARVEGRTVGKRSVGLELTSHDGGVWVPVGNVTIPPNYEVPPINSLVEIRYLYAYKGGSLFQPVYLGPRDDVLESDCTMGQLHYKSEEPILVHVSVPPEPQQEITVTTIHW